MSVVLASRLATRGICACRARQLCTHPTSVRSADSGETRLYRFAYVKPLAALLRLKALHLTAGVAVALPAYSVVSSGGLSALDLTECVGLGAVVVGTLGAGATLSWYCERIVGQVSWRREGLRISTLNVWGRRIDRDFPPDALVREGFSPTVANAAVAAAAGINPYPKEGLVPFDLGGKTFIFWWGRRHVLQPDALANVLVARAMPFPPHDIAKMGRQGAGPQTDAHESKDHTIS